MGSAANSSGSHFSSGSKNDRPVRPTSGRASSPAAPGTSASDYSDISFSSPNGSHAGASSASSYGGYRQGPSSPSDTDIFLAVTVPPASGSQPSLTPAENPAFPSSSPTSSASAPSHSAAHAGAKAGGPVNPLVAARNSGGAVVSGVDADKAHLYPISDGEASGASTSFDTSFGEANHKKTVLIVVLVVLVVAALAVVGAYFLRSQSVSAAERNIEDAIDVLRDTDTMISSLDAALSSEINGGSSASSEELSKLMLQSSSVSTKLSNAEQLIDEAEQSRGALSDFAADALDAVRSSISGRRSLIEIGRTISSGSTKIDTATTYLTSAYTDISEANTRVEASLENVRVYNELLAAEEDTGAYSLWNSVQLDQDATADIAAAQEAVASAKEVAADGSYGALDTYLTAYANYLAILTQMHTDSANGDDDAANALGDSYTQAYNDLQTAAASLPATPNDILAGVSSSSASGQQNTYALARAKCVAADNILNGYLGITDAKKKLGLTSSASSAGTSASTAAVASVTEGVAAGAAGADAEGAAVDGANGDAAAAEPAEGEEGAAEEGGEVVYS